MSPFVQTKVLQHPHGMTIFEDNVYWIERDTSKVMSTNKFHGGNVTTLMNDVYQPTGIVMDHATKQPEGKFNLNFKSAEIFIGVMRKMELAKLLGRQNRPLCYQIVIFATVVLL